MNSKRAEISADETATKRCFIITPIGSPGSVIRKHADWVYKYVNEACTARGYKLDRADTMSGSPMITARIFEAVQTADVCIADLTGLNANVFYELGVRHSLAKPVIHIASEDTDLPFDNAQHDTIFFDVTTIGSLEALTRSIERQLEDIEAPGYRVSNPFTAALGSLDLRHSGDTRDQMIARMDERLAAIERRSSDKPLLEEIPVRVRRLLSVLENSTDGRYHMNHSYFEESINDIPPRRRDIADRVFNALENATMLENRSDLIKKLIDRFPDTLPF